MQPRNAIEILSDMVKYQYSASKTKEGDAVKLGIQALNRLLLLRSGLFIRHDTLLSGETSVDVSLETRHA